MGSIQVLECFVLDPARTNPHHPQSFSRVSLTHGLQGEGLCPMLPRSEPGVDPFPVILSTTHSHYA